MLIPLLNHLLVVARGRKSQRKRERRGIVSYETARAERLFKLVGKPGELAAGDAYEVTML